MTTVGRELFTKIEKYGDGGRRARCYGLKRNS